MRRNNIPLKDRLIVALDVGAPAEARALTQRLGDEVSFYKIGYQLAFSGGLPLIAELSGAGKQVFADLKLHDIPNTVEMGTAAIAALGAACLTVHAYPQTLSAAVAGRGTSRMKVLGVTVLTSMSEGDIKAAGYAKGLTDLAMARAEAAMAAGADGVIASAEETRALRRNFGDQLLIVTPGIRPAGSAAGDQKRAATPAEAIRAGADYLVVGRPITAAADPRAAAEAILREIEASLPA